MLVKQINLSSRKEKSYYPWVIISLSACFLFYKYILQTYPSVMVLDLMGTFNITGLELGFLSAFFFYAYVMVQLFSGILIDNFSVRTLSSIAILIAALGLLIFSQTDSFLVANLARLLMGVGAAFATVSYLKVASLLFSPERFSLLAGIMASAAMLGAMCGEIPLSAAVSQFGWRTTLGWFSILGLILSATFLVLTQKNSLPTPKASFNTSSIFSGLWHTLKSRENWMLSLYCGLTFTPLNILVSLWGIPFIEGVYHLSATEAAKEISFMLIGFIIGAPLIGSCSTYFANRYNWLMGFNLVTASSLCCIIYFPETFNIFSLRILLFVLGFSTSSFMIGFNLVRELNPASLIATAIAFVNSLEALLSGLSEPLVGLLLDCWWTGEIHNYTRVFSVGTYKIAFSILPTYLIFSLFVLALIKKFSNGRR